MMPTFTFPKFTLYTLISIYVSACVCGGSVRARVCMYTYDVNQAIMAQLEVETKIIDLNSSVSFLIVGLIAYLTKA